MTFNNLLKLNMCMSYLYTNLSARIYKLKRNSNEIENEGVCEGEIMHKSP